MNDDPIIDISIINKCAVCGQDLGEKFYYDDASNEGFHYKCYPLSKMTGIREIN